jgi:predicted dehydrogenase
MINLLLIGCGPHARTFYFPALRRLGSTYEARIKAVADLVGQRGSVEGFLQEFDPSCERLYLDPFCGPLPPTVSRALCGLVKRHRIDGVIVSTDPLSHKAYAEWAMQQRLHLLLDKPITSRVNAALDVAEAQGIEEDYRQLAQSYERAWSEHKTIFSVCAHRRYHPGIDRAIEEIREVSARTGCPVTNIHAYHCDGQWRLPMEMLTQAHHSYFDGHGKVSHSGYHFLDCVIRLWRAGMSSGKGADQLEVTSSFVRPRGILRQLTKADYSKLFGKDYLEACKLDDAGLQAGMADFGEIDAETTVTFLAEEEPVALASISLLHNGFSRRAWLEPGADLYKGNGRVKHEQHRIHVGPFICVQIHSYQAKDKHGACTADDFEIGGNNHFELVIFRNAKMLGGGRPVERLRLDQLGCTGALDPSRLHIDQIKEGAVSEFLSFIRGDLTREQLRSDLSDHAMSVRLMSAVYRSYAQKLHRGSPLVTIPWTNRP